jgi:hypothetical protein
MEEQLRRIITGFRRPIVPAPQPTSDQVYAAAEREGMAVRRANENRIKGNK